MSHDDENKNNIYDIDDNNESSFLVTKSGIFATTL